ncbi:MAG: O-antigen ligase family protein [Ramlibacter sp.]
MSSSKPSIAENQSCAAAGAAAATQPDKVVLVLLALTFALYFLARGWLNAALVGIWLICIVQIARGQCQVREALSDRTLRWLVGALAAPIVAVTAVQLLRYEFVPRYFDAPLRLFMAGTLVLYFSARRVNFLRLAEFAFPAGVLLCAGYVFFWPGAEKYFWDFRRVATYFMDPLTLSTHITIAGFISLFLVDASGRDPLWLKGLKYLAFVTAIAVSIATGSRSGWVMIPLLVSLWLIGVRGAKSTRQVLLAVLAVSVACFAFYWGSDVVHARVAKGLQDVSEYFSGGDKDTSLGIRISLLRANWILFLKSPLYGWGFRGVPVLASIPEIAAFLTPLFESFFVRSGGHNEVMQSMMRMGILGLVSRLLLFGVPLVVFARAVRSPVADRRLAGYLGLIVVIGYLTASASMEVFNLIYAASFYGLLVATFAGVALARNPT